MEPWKRTLWIVFTAQLVSATGFAVMFPFLPLYVSQLGTRTNLSLEFWSAMVYSGQAITMMIASPIWGSVADRHGHKLMLERATFGGFVVLGLMAFARSAEELALLRAAQGMITGTIAAANALIAASVPRERLGYAMGILQIGMATGVSAGPLIGGLLADFFGFRASLLLTAVLVGLGGVIVWWGVPNVRPAPRSERRSGFQEWGTILRAPGVVQVYTIRFFQGLAQTMLLPILPLFITSLLHTADRVSSWTGVMVGAWSLAGTLSAFYFGRLGDRVGHRWVLIGCAFATALGFLPQAFVSSVWQLLALQLLTGFAAGGLAPALAALLGQLTPPSSAGATYGLDNSVSSGSRAVAPLLGAAMGALLGTRGVFVVIGVVVLLAGVLAVGIRKSAVVAPQPHEGLGG